MRPVDRYAILRRKHDLAQRMIVLGARTSTVTQWTGLSEYRVQQVARRFAPNRGTRRRGHSPYAPRYFARSPQIEAESLGFVYLSMEAGLIPPDLKGNPRHQLPELGRGERLVDTFDCHVALLQTVHLTLERAIALLYAFANGNPLSLRHCSQCGDLMLTQRLARDIRCPFCRKDPLHPSNSSGRLASLSSASGGLDGVREEMRDPDRTGEP